jgi:hypothetical protein
LRKAIGIAANSNAWFKREDKGQRLGAIIFKHFTSLPEDNFLKKQLTTLSQWFDQ